MNCVYGGRETRNTPAWEVRIRNPLFADKTVGNTAVRVLAHTVPYNITYSPCRYAVGY